jgi:uncharacterized protein YceK
MKRKLFTIAGVLAALMLVFVFSLSGCTSLISGTTAAETEDAKKLKDAANDVILAKDDGIAPAAFKATFERQFSGVTLPAMTAMGPNYQGTTVSFSYQDKNYRLYFTGRGGPPWTHLTSAAKCVELQAKPAK